MKKIYCDLCGEQISGMHISLNIVSGDWHAVQIPDQYMREYLPQIKINLPELCLHCHHSLVKSFSEIVKDLKENKI